jgi:hypothetical protein
MASNAIGAVVTVVVIVLEMTSDTFHVEFVVKRIVAVTVIASQLDVTSFQYEVGIACMIEARVSPRDRVVAIVTLSSAAAFVSIVICMAVEAGIRYVREGVGLVTVEARALQMLSDQWVVGRVMVERYVRPVGFIVTIRTLCADTFLVNVVFKMASNALTRGIAMFVGRLMTIFAFRLYVLTEQIHICK